MESLIMNLLKSSIMQAGFNLDKVEYVKEDNNQVLRIVIDKVGFVDVDDCVLVNNIINPILDEEDPIKEAYILEVCSKEKGSDKIGK